MIDVEKAARELLSKTLTQIEAETAYTWASRALAAYRNVAAYQGQYDGREQVLYWQRAAEEFAHEAIEHAAFAPAADEAVVREALRVFYDPRRL